MLDLYYSKLSLNSLMLFTENNTKSTFPVIMCSFFFCFWKALKCFYIYRPNSFSHNLQVHPILNAMLNFKNPPSFKLYNPICWLISFLYCVQHDNVVLGFIFLFLWLLLPSLLSSSLLDFLLTGIFISVFIFLY